MEFKDHIGLQFPHLALPTQSEGASESVPAAEMTAERLQASFPVPGKPPTPVPAAALGIANQIEAVMPLIEKITGLQRRDIFLALLKSGLKGNGIAGLVDSLTGAQKPADVKFVRYVKTLAIWVPVGVGLMGAIIVFLFLLVRLVNAV